MNEVITKKMIGENGTRLAHAPYDAVQTVDLLVGIASRGLLLYKWCGDQSLEWFR